MLRALRRYAKTESSWYEDTESLAEPIYREQVMRKVSPILWETSSITQIRSLLVLTDAELLVAKAHLSGDSERDLFVKSQIRDLETKIVDLRKWLAEAEGDLHDV